MLSRQKIYSINKEVKQNKESFFHTKKIFKVKSWCLMGRIKFYKAKKATLKKIIRTMIDLDLKYQNQNKIGSYNMLPNLLR